MQEHASAARPASFETGTAAGAGATESAISVVSSVINRQIHCTRWNNSRNRMLVDHLRDSVFEQYDILVKRVDLALQLYAIDEVN